MDSLVQASAKVLAKTNLTELVRILQSSPDALIEKVETERLFQLLKPEIGEPEDYTRDELLVINSLSDYYDIEELMVSRFLVELNSLFGLGDLDADYLYEDAGKLYDVIGTPEAYIIIPKQRNIISENSPLLRYIEDPNLPIPEDMMRNSTLNLLNVATFVHNKLFGYSDWIQVVSVRPDIYNLNYYKPTFNMVSYGLWKITEELPLRPQVVLYNRERKSYTTDGIIPRFVIYQEDKI